MAAARVPSLIFTVFALLTALIGGGACKDKGGERGGTAAVVLPPGGVQVTVDESGFKPSAVTFKKGAPASLVFLRTTDDTCATSVVFKDFPRAGVDMTKDLPKGKPVTIDIPTDKEQKLTFQCGMGMYKSSVVVN